jgi:hypothetical protein
VPNTYGSAIYGTDVYGSATAPPTNTVAPAVTGNALIGSTLTSSSGAWTESGHISYGYQWQDSLDGTTNWGNITSATSSTYVIPSTEVSKFLRCVVTDTDANGATTASSNVTAAVAWPLPVNTVAPALSGVVQVNSALTTTNGTWSDDGSPIFTYQWQFSTDGLTGWSNVTGDTSFLIPTGEEFGYLRCRVTNTGSGGAATATSNVVGPISPAPVGSLLLLPAQPGTLTLTPSRSPQRFRP